MDGPLAGVPVAFQPPLPGRCLRLTRSLAKPAVEKEIKDEDSQDTLTIRIQFTTASTGQDTSSPGGQDS